MRSARGSKSTGGVMRNATPWRVGGALANSETPTELISPYCATSMRSESGAVHRIGSRSPMKGAARARRTNATMIARPTTPIREALNKFQLRTNRRCHRKAFSRRRRQRRLCGVATPSPTAILQPHPWVQVRVQHVRDQVRENRQEREEVERALDGREVLRDRGGGEERSHPGPREDRLREDAPAHHPADAERERGHDGEHRVSGGVPVHHATLADSLRLRGRDVVFPLDLEAAASL